MRKILLTLAALAAFGIASAGRGDQLRQRGNRHHQEGPWPSSRLAASTRQKVVVIKKRHHRHHGAAIIVR